MDDLVEKTAEEMYNFACAARSKDGNKPREVGNEYKTLLEEPKDFYRNLARWHLSQLTKLEFDLKVAASDTIL
jgi:hypothetical protein